MGVPLSKRKFCSPPRAAPPPSPLTQCHVITLILLLWKVRFPHRRIFTQSHLFSTNLSGVFFQRYLQYQVLPQPLWTSSKADQTPWSFGSETSDFEEIPVVISDLFFYNSMSYLLPISTHSGGVARYTQQSVVLFCFWTKKGAAETQKRDLWKNIPPV